MTRLAWRLPAAIAILLFAVSGTLGLFTYTESRRAAVASAQLRLEDLARQLVGNFVQSAETRRRQVGTLAADPAVAAVLAGTAPPDVLRERWTPALRESATFAVDLWRDADRLVIRAEAANAPLVEASALGFPGPWASRDAVVMSSPFDSDRGAVYAIAAPVSAGNAAGWIVVRRTFGAGANPLVAELFGPGSLVWLGVPGERWVDVLGGGVLMADVPIQVLRSGAHWTAGEAGRWLGVDQTVAGTPWTVRVAFPEGVVFVQSQQLLSNTLGIVLLVTALGAGAGWWMSRRLTAPLRALTKAAVEVAEGEATPNVPTSDRDEVGALAAAFNTMAARVADSRRDLEQRVEARTGELTQALTRLAASEEQFRNVAATAPVAVVIADASGVIRFINDAGLRMFGYSTPDVVGHPIVQLMPVRYRSRHEAGMRRFLVTGESAIVGRSVELDGLHQDGHEFPLELSLGHWREDGVPVFAGTIRDLSESKAAERTLREHATQLERSNRELEAFSYSISHDLRAPLRGIDGFSEALLAEYADRLDERGIGYLTRVRKAAGRMDQLINDLLDLARVSRIELTPSAVELDRVAARVVKELRDRDPSRVVDVRIQEGITGVGDPRLLALILQNLLGNAWKFSAGRDHALIDFSTTSLESGPLTYVVRDNGVGFDMEHAGKLFGIFQRLHSLDQFPGTGVGLAIVQRIVERHGGRIWAEAKPGEGAAFFFTLSADADSEESTHA
jgi:PAS domain S-box-containing protein